MFGINKRRKIDELQIKVDRLEFIVDNPAKYKQGDKVGKNEIVTNVKIETLLYEELFHPPSVRGFKWVYTIVNKKTGSTRRSTLAGPKPRI